MKRQMAAVLAVVGLLACGGQRHSAAPAPVDRERISTQEIEASSLRTAFDLVQQLRPRWLNRRGLESFRGQSELVVYLDGARLGGIDQLRNIARASVQEIQHLDATSATQMYGTGHRAGAIVVKLRPGS